MGPSTPVEMPIGVEFLDGASGVGNEASYQRSFPSEVSSSSVTTDSFFLVPLVMADLSHPLSKAAAAQACDPANKIAASVSASPDGKTFELAPTDNLGNSANYAICLTDTIAYETGTTIEAESFSFETVAAGQLPAPQFSGIQPNGNDVNLTTDPITISFTDSMDRASVAASTTVTGSRVGAITGSYAWDAPWQVATFTPNTLPPCDTVTVAVGTGAANTAGTNLTVAATQRFTTQYSYDTDFTNAAVQNSFDTCWSRYQSIPLGDMDSFTAAGLVITPPTTVQIGPNGVGEFYWYKTIADAKISATLHITSFSFTSAAAGSGSAYLGFRDTTAETLFAIGITSDGTIGRCYATLNLSGAEFASTAAGVGNPCDIIGSGTGEIWLRTVRSTDQFSAFYSTDGTNFVQLGATQPIANLGASGGNYRTFIEPIDDWTLDTTFSFTAAMLDFSW